MPIVSKYSTDQIEKIVNTLLEQLRAEQATTELSLMCLGNTISHIINTSVPVAQRLDVASQFGQALKDAVSSKKQ
ncbi:DUF1414 domain-containing protein [Rheinheimera mesophila]|uniref:DUF1414 domain-containing protein n=1 Tax=Rheinheimera mesophila TaxID=1547515 RepID=A0A3P3QP70_9GAMM|nr:DUF1414 domain-containing protein [Rheinheimera mesophila]KKL02279.1 hypothetical protein SD53_06120 [Rheinheimera mesophila]RRJ23011.1 DUF1414 domain-containing protein [Rheinheimera mesophila]